MPENEVDEIAREFRQLGTAAAGAVAAWRRRNPGKTRIPRRVRKEATRELREAMRAHEQLLVQQRREQRASIEGWIHEHRRASLDIARSAPGTPEQFQHVQWAHATQRYQVEQMIAASPHLTREERGQAVMALVSAHYADNPKVGDRPVWGPKPYGISALKARAAERLSRVQAGLEQRRERRAPSAPRPPAAPGMAGLHRYWSESDPATQQNQAANARIAELERRLQSLAEFRDREREQLQTRLRTLGEQLLDARDQHRSVADQLAQRGRELTDVHAELGHLREQYAELRQEQTPPAPAEPRTASTRPQQPAAPEAGPEPVRPPSPAAGPGPIRDGQEVPEFPTTEELVAGLSDLVQRNPAAAEHVMRNTPDLAGAVAERLKSDGWTYGGANYRKTVQTPQVKTTAGLREAAAELGYATTTVVNGSRKTVIDGDVHLRGTPEAPVVLGAVIDRHGAMSVPDIPLPPEPPDGLEPPDMR